MAHLARRVPASCTAVLRSVCRHSVERYSVTCTPPLFARFHLVKVTLSISLAESKTATISLKGPADRWFAVGLGAKIMFDQPYTLGPPPPKWNSYPLPCGCWHKSGLYISRWG